MNFRITYHQSRGETVGPAPGGRGGGRAPQNLADQLTLFEPGWADFAPHTTASTPTPPPPRFKKLSTPLWWGLDFIWIQSLAPRPKFKIIRMSH